MSSLYRKYIRNAKPESKTWYKDYKDGISNIPRYCFAQLLKHGKWKPNSTEKYLLPTSRKVGKKLFFFSKDF